MTTMFSRHELPIAYAMIAAARRIRSRRDGGHLFQQYFFYWTAFNVIYSTIAHNKGLRSRIIRNDDGSIATVANGNVNIPRVETISEREQIGLASQELSDDLKHALILHPGTSYFVHRVPSWQGKKIEHDAFGQRINGVINIRHTSDSQYPVWSPIDLQIYERYSERPSSQDRDLLTRQILDLLFTVRENWMRGSSRRLDDANDMMVVESAVPLLELIVEAFSR